MTQTRRRARSHQPVERVEVGPQRVAVDLPHLEDDAALLQREPGADIGFMVEIGDDDLVARLELAGHGGREETHQHRRRMAEHDLFRVGWH